MGERDGVKLGGKRMCRMTLVGWQGFVNLFALETELLVFCIVELLLILATKSYQSVRAELLRHVSLMKADWGI